MGQLMSENEKAARDQEPGTCSAGCQQESRGFSDARPGAGLLHRITPDSTEVSCCGCAFRGFRVPPNMAQLPCRKFHERPWVRISKVGVCKS